MNHKLIQKMLALALAAVLLIGMLPGIPVLAAEALSVAFADPYAKVGQPMNLDVQGGFGTTSYSWMVDGVEVDKDATYTPAEEDLMKWISVSVTCGTETAKAEMFFSNLPVVYINTEGGAPIVSKETYIDAELVIQGNEMYNSENTKLYSGATEIRGRGNSTWGQPKKPYRLKLDKKTDVFGMGKSKHWVLLANYMDESLLRNTLAYDLSGAMGMEQCSTVFVDVILNGDFVGNYQFCENIRIDDTRVDIFDWESFCEDSAAVIAETDGMDEDTAGDLESYMAENMGWITSGSFDFNGKTYSIAGYPDIEVPSINGGYLIELDEYYDELSKFRTNNNQPIMFKNPEYLYTNSDMMNFVKTYIQAFEDAVQADSYTAEYEGETLHYSELFDFNALIDYWVINEIFFNEELNKKSTYMYKDIDGLMLMGPIWDMDWSSGGEGQTYHTEQWATRFYSTNAQANSWYKSLIQDPWFFIKAQERYWEIRYAQVADMLTQIDESYEMLKVSAKANGERWGYGKDYKSYVDSLRDWFNSHLTWLDEQMATQDSLRDSLGYHPSSRLALSLTDAEGNALSAEIGKNAPADAVAAEGQNLKLVVTGGNNTDGNAVLYVNGRRTSVTAVNANSTYTLDVPAESLTAPKNEKNVLEVQIEKADGSINASRYVTVVIGAVHEHSYEAKVTEPTCTEGGYTTYTCACGDSYIDDKTDALGHDGQIIPGVEATFDDKGLSDGIECARCGLVLVEQVETPIRDYNEGIIPLEVLIPTAGDWQTGYEATEGPANLAMDDNLNTIWHTDWYGTSRENHWIQFELTESYTVDGLRYKPRVTGNTNGTITRYDILVSDDGVNFRSVASGDWEGNRNWKVVEFDGENVKYVRLLAVDALTDNAYVFASASEIRLTGTKAGETPHEHSYEAVVTAPTCTEGGYTTYTCACGDSYVADEVEALGHDYEIVVTDPTCTTEGYTTYTCTRCDHSFVDDTKPALGHDYVAEVTDPFCLTGGYTTYTCTVCGHSYVADETPALSHDYALTEYIDPTCTEGGYYVYTCNRCGKESTDWYDALGHEYVNGKCTRCSDLLTGTFEDVPAGSFCFDAVEWAVEQGITTGTTPTTFNPTGNLLRAEVVTMLWRAAGKPEPTSTETTFTDVKEGSFYYKAVLWAVEQGITTGVSKTKFDPAGVTNRAQAVTFLWRANGKTEPTSNENPFTDVKEGSFCYKAVLWAVEEGITTGVSQGVFGLNDNCNRAQMVTFLYRAAN